MFLNSFKIIQVATAYPLQKFGSRFTYIGTINLYTQQPKQQP